MVTGRTYVVEISSTSYRGRAVAFLELMKGLGPLVVTGLIPVLKWHWQAALISCLMFIMAVAIVPFFPESPTFLLLRGQETATKEVLRRLKGDGIDMAKEVARIKEINPKITGFAWTELLKQENLKRIGTVSALLSLSMFTGSEVVKVNMTRMLQMSGITLDPGTSTIITMAVGFSGSICFVLLVDRIGRRKCLVSSLVINAVAFIVLGLAAFLSPDSNLAPVVDMEAMQLNISSMSYYPKER